MKEKVYVYIGRFQMTHGGHEAVIKHASQKADRLVLLVGSSELARDPKNPFTFEERKSVLEAMSQRIVSEEWSKGRSVKVDILPIHDYTYNNTKWLKEVQNQVRSVTNSTDITLAGCRKNGDESTFYLDFFPHWKQDFIEEVTKVNHAVPKEYREMDSKVNPNPAISSTELRNQFFSTKQVPVNLPPETTEFLEKFKVRNADILDNLVNEHNFVVRYRQQMNEQLPYTNIPFLTGDALVVCAGHVLLVKRRTYPGKGLWALPGGFFDAWQDQTQVDTALRELKEETKIDVRYKELKGSIDKVEEFGDFNRSLRWRIITKCAYIKLNGNKLPKVKGSDDAEKAFWVPLSEIANNRHMFFEDHLSIIDTFLGIL
ncbi:nicotinamide-nucleotide adenylyltransferase [Salmonella phage SE_PL]|uniref:NUDIX domain-containing protein n=1 Tax=Salmonella enterica TaxID=28901 RepID=UPI000FDF6AB2|nr:adenylyltransferase [Salmonella phage Munch]EAZ2022926.1 NUDIX domain-containing protein [Salmonella enterica]ECV9084060.1 NUDIX domain-containing protein [Salmonella enterica subsp. enterica serovar Infantis]MCP0435838.1 NUDIX domain-containing protein [Salmonella enterica subsp. enterica serovar Mbandaka]QCW18814.1 bifunctional nicotinamide mononucleotide adenylyltransferase/ADP-ribose pyrophosphatase [Salmonella phage 7t3]QIG62904.1 nicotinamide-nucleotide adenylyltransferase [Salmonella